MSESPKARILIIRGGAIGDFVLTLPALRLLRETFPDAHIELMGYPHIAALVDGRYYVDAVRSINMGPVAGFFAKNGTLDPALSEYFAGFQQVVSYLFDPDKIFEENVRKAGVKNYLAAFRKVTAQHAAREWAAPLEGMALYLEDPAARIFLKEEDFRSAREWLGTSEGKRLVIHPGSGSGSKNWPVEGWANIAKRFLDYDPHGELLVIAGEADEEVLAKFRAAIGDVRIRFVQSLPLPLLAGILQECGRFVGHDTGIAHIAAAVGAECVLLFGPTDPAIWAPQNPGVSIMTAPDRVWSKLTPGAVWRTIQDRLFP